MQYKKAKIINKSLSFIIFLSSIMIIALMVFLTKFSSFWGDDIHYSVYRFTETFLDCFLNKDYLQVHGGGYIGLFLSKFLSYKLPIMLDLHPSDFIKNELGFIKGILTVIVLLAITHTTNIFNKSKLLYTLTFIFLSGYFFHSIYTSYTWVPYINYNYFRYFFSFLFFSIFLTLTYKTIINPINSKNITNIIWASLCGLILGTSIEISFFLLITIFIGILIYNFVFKLQKKLSLAYKLGIDFYIPNIFLIISTLFFTSTKGFHEVITTRGLENININWGTTLEFCKEYINICIYNEIIFWLILIVLSIIAFKIAIKKKETKKINFIFIYIASLLTVMFSLILCGKTCLMAFKNGPTFFIEHINIIFLYKILLIIPAIMFLSYICRNITINKRKIVHYFFIISILTLCFNFIFDKNKENYWDFKQNYLLRKQRELYIVEKLTRFYLLKNQQPLIYKIDNEFFNYDLQTKCRYGETIFTNYYSGIYKTNKIEEIGYCRSNNAINEFYKNGGTFEINELENLDFNRLKDKNFILNKRQKNTKQLSQKEVLNKIQKELE